MLARMGGGLTMGMAARRAPGGGGPAVTAATWNPADKGTGVVLSNGNLTAVGDGSTWRSCRSTRY